MTSVILQRIRQRTDEILSEAQAGFRAGRSTVDQLQLFTLRGLAETYSEFSIRSTPYVCYVDFQKVFNSVWRIGLWRVTRFLGYEDKIVRILVLFEVSRHYECSQHQYRTVRMVFTVIEVMQGCVLLPVLFNILLEVVIALALEGNEIGATISGNLLSNFRFADAFIIDANILAGPDPVRCSCSAAAIFRRPAAVCCKNTN